MIPLGKMSFGLPFDLILKLLVKIVFSCEPNAREERLYPQHATNVVAEQGI